MIVFCGSVRELHKYLFDISSKIGNASTHETRDRPEANDVTCQRLTSPRRFPSDSLLSFSQERLLLLGVGVCEQASRTLKLPTP